jgi:hypothetical protein
VFWDVFSAGNPGKAGQPTADAQAYIEASLTKCLEGSKTEFLILLSADLDIRLKCETRFYSNNSSNMLWGWAALVSL